MPDEPTPRVILPSFLVGPAVLIFLFGTIWACEFTNPIHVPVADLSGLLIFLALSSLVGFLPAFAVNFTGARVMIELGRYFPLTRLPMVWALAGGVIAWTVVRYFEFVPEWTFAYTAAGTFSALLCRMRLA